MTNVKMNCVKANIMKMKFERDCIEEPWIVNGEKIGIKDDPISLEIRRLCQPFMLSNGSLRHLMNVFDHEIEEGLRVKDDSKSSLKMLPSFIRALPNGKEEGNFLALDLGGTNFRVLSIEIHQGVTKMVHETFSIADSIVKGTGVQLFDRIAECLNEFLTMHNLKSAENLPLGFTFSFPCLQTELTSAKLITWTKGFSASGVENKDVVQLLRDACRRREDVNVDVIAVLNDTVGTLMSCAFIKNECHIGLIVGTGTNACYMENLSRCPKFEELKSASGHDEMIINMEWGALGDNGKLHFLRTGYDAETDFNSINPGKQLFEKMISGMYLGEIVRVTLMRLAEENLIFDGKFEGLKTPFLFSTRDISRVETESEENACCDYKRTTQILKNLGVGEPTKFDCETVAYVCSVISTRAAFLCAAGLAALIDRIDKQHIAIGIDGSVYRYHPTFARNLDRKIRELIKEKHDFELVLSEDGSGRGAALVAAVAKRVCKESIEQNMCTMHV